MDRYDRQVRVWAPSGQVRLRDTRVRIQGISVATSEAAKNLVLAGVGEVFISDSRAINSSQRASNFFLGADCGSQNAAEALKSQLNKLNPEVTVTTVDPGLKGTTVIVASTPQPEQGIPVIHVATANFDGMVRISARELCIMEPHPDPAAAVDLRVITAWPELRQWADSINLEGLNNVEHAHIPSLMLLIKAVADFDGDLHDRAGQKLFRQAVRDMARIPSQENVEEAVKFAWRVWREPVPDGLKQLFNWTGPRYDHTFWHLVDALKIFVERHEEIPLPGSLPDMVTTTEQYLRLQEIFAAKAERDVQEMVELIRQSTEDDIPVETVRTFCKNARFVQAIVKESEHASLRELAEGPELAPVAAIVGGVAAQEATKIATGQYTPLAGCFWFDGTSQSSNIDFEGMLHLNA